MLVARIAGVNLPTQKRLEIGLTYIYGIGRSTAQKIIRELELDPDEKVRDHIRGLPWVRWAYRLDKVSA